MNLPRVSPNGRALCDELSFPAQTSLKRCLKLIQTDNLAGRVVIASGENAFHLTVGLGHPSEVVLSVLRALLASCPEGARQRSKQGRLPLHLALAQSTIVYEAVELLLETYPQAASVADEMGHLPLFLCVMHEDASPALAELCRMLCKAFPQGPATLNKTRSHPLHFASRRVRPNLEVSESADPLNVIIV